MTTRAKKQNFISANIWFLVIVAVALIGRVIFILATQNIGGPGAMDSQTYQSIATNLLKGVGYSEDGTNPSIFVAPLYPLTLAAIYKIFGFHSLTVELFQCILGVGTAIFAFLIARKVFNISIALVVLAIVAFAPELFVLSTFLYTESLFIFLLMGTAWALFRLVEHPTSGRIALAGLLAGLATLTRGVTMLLPAILFLALLTKFRPSHALKVTLAFGLFFILPILPWTVRNYLTFHAVIPIAVGNGDVLWTGNYLPFDGKYNYEKTRAMMDSMSQGMNQIDRNDFFIREARKNMAAEPVKTAGLLVRKIYRFWFWVYESIPSGQKRQSATLIQLVLKVFYYPLLGLFIMGLVLTLNRWRDLALFYLLLFYYMSIHVMTLVVPRYRFPVLPMMAIFAAYSLYWLWQRWSNRAPVLSTGKIARQGMGRCS